MQHAIDALRAIAGKGAGRRNELRSRILWQRPRISGLSVEQWPDPDSGFHLPHQSPMQSKACRRAARYFCLESF
jgi:hypothetical protein